ncbi:purine-nucleoside phosphorylase [Alkalihalobacillus sp. LMS39]|uniref:purine-nucleoside phosphorylase n=1 Tax=Alkalihalobacillus sp. LMS39 TaxID=2924032 RepID=UPI001FB4BCE9|nr:purine-nucleoside phosphorylase [Alkalihalobacillus sp. LMS39]UOE96344.1 purine-nucleoside phosphorylase [Alkalihalobacillus sp. LMS39]
MEWIQSKVTIQPKVGLILGSGLGVLADEIEHAITLPYADIPGFPVSTVEGHAGQLVIGELEGMPVMAMQGRFHYYEGYDLDDVTFPIRVMKEIGIETMMVTNAAGSLNQEFQPGDLMLITDHINQAGTNPLIGRNEAEWGVRFPDMSTAYTPELQTIVKEVAKACNVDLKTGVYVWNSGPSYETPAEVRMLRAIGGDAVGMSTVPEVIVARHCDINVIGMSCITNMAAGILDQPLSHDEVMETADKVRETFTRLVKAVVRELRQANK